MRLEALPVGNCAVSVRVTDPEQAGRRRVLCVCWTAGLLAGWAVSRVLGIQLYPVVLLPRSPWPEISRMAAEVVCAAAVGQLGAGKLVPAAGFVRAAVFGFTVQGVCARFGSAGWLVWPLVSLPQLLIFPLLFFLWLPARGFRGSRWAYPAYAVAASAVGYGNFRLVMPFLAFLIE